jgi:hypothetical protein
MCSAGREPPPLTVEVEAVKQRQDTRDVDTLVLIKGCETTRSDKVADMTRSTGAVNQLLYSVRLRGFPIYQQPRNACTLSLSITFLLLSGSVLLVMQQADRPLRRVFMSPL